MEDYSIDELKAVQVYDAWELEKIETEILKWLKA